MANGLFIQKGETIDYLNGGASAIGYKDVIPMVTRVGVAGENIAVGACGSVNVEGIYELPAVTNAPFAVGDQLYWDTATGTLTKVSAGMVPAGWCVETKITATAVARVKIG